MSGIAVTVTTKEIATMTSMKMPGMTPQPRPAGTSGRRSGPRFALPAMRAWHAIIAGGFLVAWMTADSEDLYMMHQVAGYTVLIAVVLRLAVGLFATRAPWRLPRPTVFEARRWMTERRGRNPGFAWLAVTLLVTVGASAGAGMAAHWLPQAEDLHGALSDAALWVIAAHGLFIIALFGGLRRVRALVTRDA